MDQCFNSRLQWFISCINCRTIPAPSNLPMSSIPIDMHTLRSRQHSRFVRLGILSYTGVTKNVGMYSKKKMIPPAAAAALATAIEGYCY